MLTPNPDDRITLQQIRRHPWVNLGCNDLPLCTLPLYPTVDGIPDPDIIAKLCYFGFKPQSVVKKLQTCTEPCQEATMYHVLLKKKEKDQKRRMERQNGAFFKPRKSESEAYIGQLSIHDRGSSLHSNAANAQKSRRQVYTNNRITELAGHGKCVLNGERPRSSSMMSERQTLDISSQSTPQNTDTSSWSPPFIQRRHSGRKRMNYKPRRSHSFLRKIYSMMSPRNELAAAEVSRFNAG